MNAASRLPGGNDVVISSKGPIARPSGGPGGADDRPHPAVGVADQHRRVPGRGHAERLVEGLQDAVHRGREPRGHAGARLQLGGHELRDVRVEQGQQVARPECRVRGGPHGGAGLAHDRGGGQTAARDVADPDPEPPGAQIGDVEPVAADVDLGAPGHVAGGDVHLVQHGQDARQQGPLQGEGDLPLGPDVAHVRDGGPGPGGHVLEERQVGLLEGPAVGPVGQHQRPGQLAGDDERDDDDRRPRERGRATCATRR